MHCVQLLHEVGRVRYVQPTGTAVLGSPLQHLYSKRVLYSALNACGCAALLHSAGRGQFFLRFVFCIGSLGMRGPDTVAVDAACAFPSSSR